MAALNSGADANAAGDGAAGGGVGGASADGGLGAATERVAKFLADFAKVKLDDETRSKTLETLGIDSLAKLQLTSAMSKQFPRSVVGLLENDSWSIDTIAAEAAKILCPNAVAGGGGAGAAAKDKNVGDEKSGGGSSITGTAQNASSSDALDEQGTAGCRRVVLCLHGFRTSPTIMS